jgi:hypothetical protein
MITVPSSDTAMEPRQPSRLEKKPNMIRQIGERADQRAFFFFGAPLFWQLGQTPLSCSE